MVEVDEAPERTFPGLFEYHATSRRFTLQRDAVIRLNDIYGRLGGSRGSIREVLADPTDFKQGILDAKDQDEKLHFAQLLAIQRLAVGVNRELDVVFKALSR